MRSEGGQGADRSQVRWYASARNQEPQTVVGNGSQIGRGHREAPQRWSIRPGLSQAHGPASVRHAKTQIVTDTEASAIGGQIGVCEIKMSGGENQDVLDIAGSETGIGRKNQGGHTSHQRGGSGSAA